MDEALLRLLGAISPRVEQMYLAHVEEYGELLSTVLLADVARYAFGENDRSVIDAVNDLLILGSPQPRNVLLTGFVEGSPVETSDDMVRSLPEPLQTEVARDLNRTL